jgi:RND family efflux transporter MFP subunit
MRSLILFSVLLTLAGCGHDAAKEARPESKATPIAAQTVAVTELERDNVYEATGTVRARTSGTVASKIPAYVRQVHAAVGDTVRAGQKLVTLDARELDAAIRRVDAARTEVKTAMGEADNGVAGARAQFDLASATFKRMNELAEKKSITRQEFDEASARLQSAKAMYEMARSKRAQLEARLAQVEEERKSAVIMREYADIASPFAGVISTRSVEPGNLASPGMPLFTIERADGFRLEAAVEESKLASVKVGQTVEASIEALGKSVTARVGEIVPAGDAGARSYTVKIDLPYTPQLRTGMFGRARFAMGKRKVLVAPAGAVQERGQLQTVYVVEDGHARSRVVTIGAQGEVLSGLQAGEKVIAPAPASLYDGARVEVRP